MPREWHDRHWVNKIEDEGKRDFYRRIVADRKPYFMRYIYPELMRQYNTYKRNTDRNALREFGMTVGEMQALPYSSLTDRQREFLRYYEYRMPVGIRNCVMNRICRRFEEEFDGFVVKQKSKCEFDYTILCSSEPYTARQYQAVRHLYDAYTERTRSYAMFTEYERVDDDEAGRVMADINAEFKKECFMACPNGRVLCNILLDVCYTTNTSKRFVWRMAGWEIIQNLLDRSGGVISFPALDPDGEIEYGGNRFTLKTKEIGVTE